MSPLLIGTETTVSVGGSCVHRACDFALLEATAQHNRMLSMCHEAYLHLFVKQGFE